MNYQNMFYYIKFNKLSFDNHKSFSKICVSDAIDEEAQKQYKENLLKDVLEKKSNEEMISLNQSNFQILSDYNKLEKNAKNVMCKSEMSEEDKFTLESFNDWDVEKLWSYIDHEHKKEA